MQFGNFLSLKEVLGLLSVGSLEILVRIFLRYELSPALWGVIQYEP